MCVELSRVGESETLLLGNGEICGMVWGCNGWCCVVGQGRMCGGSLIGTTELCAGGVAFRASH